MPAVIIKKPLTVWELGEFFTNIQPVTTHFFPISSAAWDYNMLRWLEKNGYGLGYVTNIDTHRNNVGLSTAKIFMSHGHDEYWSGDMRNHLEKANHSGTNLAFFSSNTMFWQIRFEPSKVTLEKDRIMVCYKDLLDPNGGVNATINFRDPPIDNPEAKLLGVQHFMDPVDGDIIVSNENHWIYKNTGLKNGDKLKGLLGYEIDQVTEQSPKNIEILAISPGKNLLENSYSYATKQLIQKVSRVIDRKTGNNIGLKLGLLGVVLLMPFLVAYLGQLYFGKVGLFSITSMILIFFLAVVLYIHKNVTRQNRYLSTTGCANMTLYNSNQGSGVFATGSMQWSWGLDDYNVPQLRTSRKHESAQIITKNVLDHFIAFSQKQELKNSPNDEHGK